MSPPTPQHVPVGLECVVSPQIPLARSLIGPLAVGTTDCRCAMREPVMPGLSPVTTRTNSPINTGLRLVDLDTPAH